MLTRYNGSNTVSNGTIYRAIINPNTIFLPGKFNFAKECVKKYIKTEHIIGDGGLHLFLELKNIDTRNLLEKCYKKDVIFMPGDLFYIDNKGKNTLRLGLSRLSDMDIEKGIKIIGETIDELNINA